MSITDALRRILGTVDKDPIDQDFLRAQADMGETRVTGYRTFDSYYDGTRYARLTELAKLHLEQAGVPFAENFVEKVVDTHARCLTVEAFEVQDNPQASEWLSTTAWPAARGPELQSVVHTKTIGLGDGFLLADWDPIRQLPTLRWNRPHIVRPTYNEETGELEVLSKVWATSARSPTNPDGRLISRMNLYYPDRIEKWFAVSAGNDALWARHLDESDETWPVWWTDNNQPDGEPLGLLGVHFRRKPLGQDFGRSKVREAIPFQDELTKAVLDLFEVMDAQGWQQRWATGVNTDRDRLVVRPGEIVSLTNADARLGQFDAADPTKLGAGIDGILQRMAAKTNTPLHDLIKGTPPSGESLKTARMDLVSEAKDNQVTFGHSWAEAGRMLLKLAAVHGVEGAPEIDPDAQIRPVWADPEVRNEKDEAMVLVAYKEIGASDHTLLRRAGFDPDEERDLRALEEPDLLGLPGRGNGPADAGD